MAREKRLFELDRFCELAAVARGVPDRDLAFPFDEEFVFDLAEAGDGQKFVPSAGSDG